MCRGADKAKIGRSRLHWASAIPAGKPQRFQIWEELHDFRPKLDRRSVLKSAAAVGVLPIASPFIISARGESPVRIGMVDPLTGVYAAPAGNE